MAIYKRDRGFELGATEKQIQKVVQAGLEPGTLDCESDTLITRPSAGKSVTGTGYQARENM